MQQARTSNEAISQSIEERRADLNMIDAMLGPVDGQLPAMSHTKSGHCVCNIKFDTIQEEKHSLLSSIQL